MFYICFFEILLLWLIVGYRKGVPRKAYILFPLLLIGFLIGLRYQTGRDLNNYELLFFRAVNRQKEYYNGAELSYIFLSQLFDFLGMDFQALVLFYALLSCGFIYKGLCALQIEKKEYIGFICTFYALGFSTFFILMRQFLSASIIFFAFSKYGHTRKDLRKSVVLLIFAGLIHAGAIVIFPLFFLFKSKLFKNDMVKGVTILLSICIGGSPLVFHLIRLIVRYFPQYEYYLEKENFGSGQISRIILLLTVFYFILLCLKQKYRIMQEKNEIISSGICFALFIYYVTLPLGWFHRSYWYLTLFLYFFPSYFTDFFTCKRATTFVYTCLCSLYIINIYYNIGIAEPLMVPYKFNILLFKWF